MQNRSDPAGIGPYRMVLVAQDLELRRNLSKVLYPEVPMPSRFATIEAEALKLSPVERVSLADHLLASVGPKGEVEDAWSAEIDRRLADVEAGRTVLVPVEEAIQRARRALS